MTDFAHVIEVVWEQTGPNSSLYSGRCSCDWRSPFATTERDLVVEEVKGHIAEVKAGPRKQAGF